MIKSKVVTCLSELLYSLKFLTPSSCHHVIKFCLGLHLILGLLLNALKKLFFLALHFNHFRVILINFSFRIFHLLKVNPSLSFLLPLSKSLTLCNLLRYGGFEFTFPSGVGMTLWVFPLVFLDLLTLSGLSLYFNIPPPGLGLHLLYDVFPLLFLLFQLF